MLLWHLNELTKNVHLLLKQKSPKIRFRCVIKMVRFILSGMVHLQCHTSQRSSLFSERCSYLYTNESAFFVEGIAYSLAKAWQEDIELVYHSDIALQVLFVEGATNHTTNTNSSVSMVSAMLLWHLNK